ncbi:hypothetical protein B5F98_06410 [Pseudoflavonifractor sp. An44]|nr:hypothetical protein B5F98_06410 [Pseudoflavonifractor sp. An44]
MSACVFIAADVPLPEVRPSQDYLLHINLDNGIISDGGTDDNYSLLPFDEVDLYCNKKYGVYLELPQFTDGRARKIMEYIRAALLQADCVEIWNVWLMGCWEYDDRPYIRKSTIHMEELTVDDMKEIINAENWDNKDKNRPSFYCLELIR